MKKKKQTRPYRSRSIAALAQLLNHAAVGSAEQRVIQEELRFRQLRSEPVPDQLLLFAPNEWAEARTPWIVEAVK